MRKPGVAEMDVRVYYPRNDRFAFGVDAPAGKATRESSLAHFGDSISLNEYVAFESPAFVYDVCVVYQYRRHVTRGLLSF